MISHLNGTLEHVDKNHVVVDVGGVGYKVFLPTAALARLPKVGEKIKLFTFQVVREDELSLYGFLTKEERSLFSLLLTVNGIGPKVSLSILSAFPLDRIVTAITQGNATLISSIPGIGGKTAQKLIIELKEKVAKAYALKPAEMTGGLPGNETIVSDAIAALISLGYSPKEARESILRIGEGNLTSVEEIVKQALRQLL
ncbi:MAG: Holliday junction branch migration protein RuvA [Candidatus Margulisbacteria bacterium]|nr:Holliday junction branch migration protein RuvA [Candidatus Margulisiibacteriota bacterium]